MEKYNETHLSYILRHLDYIKKNIQALNIYDSPKQIEEIFGEEIRMYESQLEEVCPSYKRIDKLTDKIIDLNCDQPVLVAIAENDLDGVMFMLRFNGYSSRQVVHFKTNRHEKANVRICIIG